MFSFYLFLIGFSLTALIGWCGRLSVHDSCVFSVYGSTLRLKLPDGDSPPSYWHFDPMHNPEILVHMTLFLHREVVSTGLFVFFSFLAS